MLHQDIQQNIVNYLLQHSASKVGLFGSYARNEQTDKSDLDILVSFKKPMSLLKLIGLQIELSENTGLNIDLVTENSLKNEKLKRYIFNDLITLYDEKR